MTNGNAPARYLAIGDALPDVALPLLGGGMLSTGAFRGRHVLLFMWSSW